MSNKNLKNLVEELPEPVKISGSTGILEGMASLDTGNLGRKEENIPVDEELKARIRREFPVPPHFNFFCQNKRRSHPLMRR